jgi:GNAT superfamily N-acetyltransferase
MALPIVEVPWHQTELLRSLVLDWRRGPVPGDEDPTAVHLAQLDAAGDVSAAVSYLPHPCPEHPGVRAIYLWGMAVSPSVQGRGSGRRLMAEVLKRAGTAGMAMLWLDARDSAVGFYEKCGGAAVGDPYMDDLTGGTDRRVVFEVGTR